MDEDFVRAVAAAAGIIFNRPGKNKGIHRVCWNCYQKWVCNGKKTEEDPEVLGGEIWCCPECNSKDLRSLPKCFDDFDQSGEAHSQP